ncbi:lengsin-like [Haliotis rubra]|uniref:lengsin-like n=1 Tax=Haliotis rubra TaxID=36100 RepID=UPI001EE5B909|nr:lengsin-like [Haliotis rubra]
MALRITTIAKQWIAGILKHSKAICAFANPTVNCYRNFFKLFYPLHIYWGIEDREACVRIKNKTPCTTYIENRLPSGKSNTYLVMASTIAAGLDGVNKKMECPAKGKSKDTDSLPCSLAEALAELEQDVDLCHALGDELVTWFVKSKKDAEIAKYDGIEINDTAKSSSITIYSVGIEVHVKADLVIASDEGNMVHLEDFSDFENIVPELEVKFCAVVNKYESSHIH